MQSEDAACELIHNHSLWMMPNVYAGQAAAARNVPLVVSPRGTLSPWAFKSGSVSKRLFWPLLQRPAIEAAACFHATSTEEARHIREAGFAQPVAVIPNGIDVPEPGGQMRQHERRVLLFVGRLHPIKGLDILVRAWLRVRDAHPAWDLHIVGPDDVGYGKELRRIAGDLVRSRIRFVGPLWGESKLEAYRAADLFVLPSHSENFGVAVAEALAAGTPVIASKGAPWSGLEQHAAGWWADATDEGIVAALEKGLSLDQETLCAMGANGRRWMMADFSWTRIGEMTLQTYRWIVDGGVKPAWVWDGR